MARKRLLPDPRTLQSYAAIPNVSAVEVRTDGTYRIEFHAKQGATAASGPHTPATVGSTPAPATEQVKLVPGTPFPDDNSPINPIDLVFFPPQGPPA
jgi:hypothetical protein